MRSIIASAIASGLLTEEGLKSAHLFGTVACDTDYASDAFGDRLL